MVLRPRRRSFNVAIPCEAVDQSRHAVPGDGEPALQIGRTEVHVTTLVNFTKYFAAFERRTSGAFEIAFEWCCDCPVQSP
jgi:hypothetical protein